MWKKYLFTLAIGTIGIGMMLNGCAKRVKPESVMPMIQEEQVTSPPEIGEAVTGMVSPGIQESDVAAVKGAVPEPTESTDEGDTDIFIGIGSVDLTDERDDAGLTIGKRDVDLSAGGLATIYFDFDKFNIRRDMRPVIEANAKWLLSHPEITIRIEGHADEQGTNAYNLALGERRAQAMKRFLMALGVKTGRLSTISYGEEQPVCTGRHETCYSENRRTHFGIRGQ